MRDSSLRRSTRLTAAATSSGSGGGSRSKWLKTWRTCWGVSAGVFPPQPPPLHGHEPQRQQRQRHVVVPAHPAAHLVVRQPDLALALLQHLLDAVPLAVDAYQGGPPLPPACVAQRVPRLRLSPQAADDGERLGGADVPALLLGLHAPLQRPDFQRPLGTVPDREGLPPRRRLPG